MSSWGHSRPINSTPVPIIVRCWSNRRHRAYSAFLDLSQGAYPPDRGPSGSLALNLVRATASCARLARHFETFAGIRNIGAVHPQDREVPVHIIADQEIAAVRRKTHGLRQCADV